VHLNTKIDTVCAHRCPSLWAHVTEDHSWGKEKRIQTDEDEFSLDVNNCDDTWNTLGMRLTQDNAAEITGIDDCWD